MNIMVIVNYNDSDNTIKLINQVSGYNCIDKIIIVDNCSTDNSINNFSKINNKKVDIVVSDYNGGYAYGNNFGIHYAEKRYKIKNIIISNSDISVKETSIIKIIEFLACNKNIGIATGVIRNSNNDISGNLGWKLPRYRDMLINNFYTSYKISRLINKSIYYNTEEILNVDYAKVEAVSGCFFIVRYEAIRNVGYFDEKTFLFMEENILGKKMMAAGYGIYVVTGAQVYHLHVSKKGTSKSRVILQNAYLDSCSYYMKRYLKVPEIGAKIFSALYFLGRYEWMFASKISALLLKK
ncbi:glycosyltransferase [Neobacillus niacini]|uniref:glycosyltransferase n=1 Tax=Neobacillus niacini TaxID=86668 RepID=UPI00203C8BEF|nr:glycosyltransferase family 2 protein [Neobacillus niacini]MCM3693201.1 glycosyltransferase family 2 protein [Neobacillus niacini]